MDHRPASRDAKDPAPVLADPRWLAALDDAYGKRSRTIPYDGGALDGYESRDFRGRRQFHALADSLAGLAPGEAGRIAAGLAARFRDAGYGEAWLDIGADESAGYRRRVRTSPTLDLAPGADAVWRGFRDKVRNTIRKAERARIEVSRDPAHFDAFHALYARAMDEKGAAIRSRAFFRAILRRFGGDATLYTAWRGGVLLGGALIVRRDGQALYPYGAANAAGKKDGATSLLLWRAIADLCAAGAHALDLGPSQPGSGTYRFKIHLGAVPRARHVADVLSPVLSAPSSGAAPPPAGPGGGRAMRLLGTMPRALRIPARIWLGRFGRIL
jgi:hypothetical protein